jgi:hypothetical protein
MELEVFSDRRLALTAEWQRAIDAEGFSLRLDAAVELEHVRGVVSAMLGDKRIQFECFHDDADKAMQELGSGHFNRRWRAAIGFRWLGSSIDELQAAWMAATAYAAATGGVVFDCESRKVLTLQQARGAVGGIVRDVPRMEAIVEEINRRFARR